MDSLLTTFLICSAVVLVFMAGKALVTKISGPRIFEKHQENQDRKHQEDEARKDL